jgi:hypothetical protein
MKLIYFKQIYIYIYIYIYVHSQQRLVEFYDSRSCNDAYDATINVPYKDGVWDVAFFWDHPYK